MRWQEILDRFRPVTAPGGAAESAEHVAERSGPVLELAPVFAALDADLDAAARLTAQAEALAVERLEQARRDAAADVARARREAPAREADAAASILADAAAEDAALMQRARDDAARLLDARSPRVAEAADAVVATLQADLGAAS
ncbi:hypothetical protein RN607_02510 [Demequina capsici]|uniref:Uncharacterized protein n=1 Tax=Demequina capsici TaxID=3075620 RepID=A0AA96JA14_9MICO|nr:hypothetical protein [Demequina sp. PMTSA13]WNM27897.1 hypothetical protein RN607_02510 [Demequina sp. PMTSA13]